MVSSLPLGKKKTGQTKNQEIPSLVLKLSIYTVIITIIVNF